MTWKQLCKLAAELPKLDQFLAAADGLACPFPASLLLNVVTTP